MATPELKRVEEIVTEISPTEYLRLELGNGCQLSEKIMHELLDPMALFVSDLERMKILARLVLKISAKLRDPGLVSERPKEVLSHPFIVSAKLLALGSIWFTALSGRHFDCNYSFSQNCLSLLNQARDLKTWPKTVKLEAFIIT